jgi:hypothetical protein
VKIQGGKENEKREEESERKIYGQDEKQNEDNCK